MRRRCKLTRTSLKRLTINLRLKKVIRRLSSQISADELRACFNNPVFIVSAPRAGSTLLFSLLSQSPDIWTIGGESHGVYAQFPHLAGEDNDLSSGRLDATHADPATAGQMRLLYVAMAKDRNDRSLFDGSRPQRPWGEVVFLEKTPRNSLNIEFLNTVFPAARFIYLHRDPRENISSIMEGWTLGGKSGEFVTFRQLPDWPLGYWCFLLPPNWAGLKDCPISEIAAFQWQACNDIILEDLSRLPANQWISVSYQELVAQPAATLKRLCKFCDAGMGEFLLSRTTNNLPLSASTITPPHKDKWKRYEAEILSVLPTLAKTMTNIGYADANRGRVS